MTTERTWHARDAAAVLAALDATAGGLTQAEAAARLTASGRNDLPRAAPPSFAAVYFRQFRSPLIYILGIAALISLAIGKPADAGFVAVVLLLNAGVGGVQEWRAERSALALQGLLQARATVERDGELREIDAAEVVPGDVVTLEPGNRVPADVRLLGAHGLEVDESLLTGESMPVHKDAAWRGEADTPLADRKNMAHAGSLVARGRARGVVVQTGTGTAVGRLAAAVLGTPGGKAPLLLRMERLSRAAAVAVLTSSVVVALLGVLVRGETVADMFLFGVALAVSAIPEGLPVALTISLALASRRMARRGVIVRHLAAVEGLGSCTLIASDKTGTLTCNELTVRELRLVTGETAEVTGEGYAPAGEVLLNGTRVVAGVRAPLDEAVRCAVLCNEGDLHRRDGGWIWHGDPTDVALLSLGRKFGLSREALVELWPEENRIPFEPERRFAAAHHRIDGATHVFVKGAPERVLAMCGGLTPPMAEAALRDVRSMTLRGFRVLALASGPAAEPLDPARTPGEPTGLSLLGFVGMMDPLRPGVREAVDACRRAGIAVAMITGDHPSTAFSIARDLGLAERPDEVVTGAALTGRSPAEMRDVVGAARVFARIEPGQKLDLVRAMRAAGHFVAVTGDGVNDAPALRIANIGVAMGKSGTDIAREASQLVITDDNFSTIVAAVEEGRVAYDNIRKLVFLLASTGAAEVLMVALAVASGLPLPLLPVQLLWLNLVTNGIQDVSLAFEPAEGGMLDRRPRPPGESVFNALMIERSVLAAVVIGGVGFGVFSWLLNAGWDVARARNALLLLFVLFENVHMANCRSETRSIFVMSPWGNPVLLIGALAALGLHVAMMHLAAGRAVLRTQPVDGATWAALTALSLTLVVAMELQKWVWKRREKRF